MPTDCNIPTVVPITNAVVIIEILTTTVATVTTALTIDLNAFENPSPISLQKLSPLMSR